MVSAVSGLQARTYEDKIIELNMESIESRGDTLDMVQTFKILRERWTMWTKTTGSQ